MTWYDREQRGYQMKNLTRGRDTVEESRGDRGDRGKGRREVSLSRYPDGE